MAKFGDSNVQYNEPDYGVCVRVSRERARKTVEKVFLTGLNQMNKST